MKKFALLLLSLYGLACNPQPKSDANPEAAIGTAATLEAAREIMKTSPCTLVSVNENTMPHARVMDPIDPDENFVVWLATNPGSRKVQQLEANPNVVLHYVDNNDNGYVSLYGKAEIVKDPQQLEVHWKPEWDRFYKNKTTDCVLIKVQPVRLEIIDYKHGLSGDPLSWQPNTIIF